MNDCLVPTPRQSEDDRWISQVNIFLEYDTLGTELDSTFYRFLIFGCLFLVM